MPEVLFPEKWWKLTTEEYNDAKTALKALIAKEADSGNAEVIMKGKERKKQALKNTLNLRDRVKKDGPQQ